MQAAYRALAWNNVWQISTAADDHFLKTNFIKQGQHITPERLTSNRQTSFIAPHSAGLATGEQQCGGMMLVGIGWGVVHGGAHLLIHDWHLRACGSTINPLKLRKQPRHLLGPSSCSLDPHAQGASG